MFPASKWKNHRNTYIMLLILTLKSVRFHHFASSSLLFQTNRTLLCWLAASSQITSLNYLYFSTTFLLTILFLFHSFFQMKPPSWIFVSWQFETDLISGLIQSPSKWMGVSNEFTGLSKRAFIGHPLRQIHKVCVDKIMCLMKSCCSLDCRSLYICAFVGQFRKERWGVRRSSISVMCRI